jgi:hypothetical protein
MYGCDGNTWYTYVVLRPEISFRTSRTSQLGLRLVVMMIALIKLNSGAISLGTRLLFRVTSMAGPGSHRGENASSEYYVEIDI